MQTTPFQLRAHLIRLLERFPKLCDTRLVEGFEKLACLQTFMQKFTAERSLSHLARIFIFQFLLQKKRELFVDADSLPCYSKFFLQKRHLCLIGLIPFSATEQPIDKETLIDILQRMIPSTHEVPGSFWRWVHHELPFMCFYIEIEKLRGAQFLPHESHSLNLLFDEQLAAHVQRPPLFCPFNEEEAYKQLQVLQNELNSPKDLPQVAIHFRHQIGSNLEWLIYVAKPQHPPLEKKIEFLPPSSDFFLHYLKQIDSIEIGYFSLFLPLRHFQERHSINLLQARERVVQHLHVILGNFRDYNGGLFAAQKDVFSAVFRQFSDQIPFFNHFADKAFHALQPVEARITLACEDLKRIFHGISILMQQQEEDFFTADDTLLVFRTKRVADIHLLTQKAKQLRVIYTEFDLFPFRYFCVFDKTKSKIAYFEKKMERHDVPLKDHPGKRSSASGQNGFYTSCGTLKLAFFTGEPPSLSPYLAGGDTRCGTISKLLFEGLMRLDGLGTAVAAGASDFSISSDGTLYTFNLRPSNWSNGSEVTAFDYVYGWKKVLSRQWASNRPNLLFGIKNSRKYYQGLCQEKELGLKAESATTLHIELETPDPHFLVKLAQPIFFPSYRSSQEPYIFNGPYLVNLYRRDILELERNPNYWDEKRLFFSRVQIVWHLSAAESLVRFENGEIDWLGGSFAPLPLNLIKKFEDEKRLFSKSAMRFFIIYLNTQYSILRSPLIRKAMSLSCDRAWICQAIFPYSLPLFSAIPGLPEAPLLEQPKMARELFEAGLRQLNLSRNVLPTLVMKCAKLSGHIECAHYLKTNWEATLGLTITIEELPWNVLRSQLEKKEFQIASCFENTLSLDFREFLERFENKNDAFNFSQWEAVAYRDLLRAMASSSNKEITNQMRTLFAEQTPYIPICLHTLLYTKHPKLEGEIFDASGCVDFSFSYLKSDEYVATNFNLSIID